MVETVSIKYDDGVVKIELHPCRHCGKLPTAQNAERAVKHARDTRKGCAVCGKKPQLQGLCGLFHSSDIGEREGWILCAPQSHQDPEVRESDWCDVHSYGPAGTVTGYFHATCLKKVAPGIEIIPNR